ncbi:Hypothetical protein FKW44_002298, partial [Caligus rogercresseyi]
KMQKFFSVQATKNCYNNRILARKNEYIPVELRTGFRRLKTPSVMVWVGVPTDKKKAPMVLIEEDVK